MCKIKYYLFYEKTIHNFFVGSVLFIDPFDFSLIRMNLNKTKNDLTPKIKKDTKKSNFKVLTNENDFLVKNLKRAG